MKKKLKYLLFLIILFMMGTTTVRAERMTSTNVPNNSYIIGTHMFTDKTSLSTSHIMLAGKTIDSDNLNDMIMYYKTPRGKWINGATGESITAPANFKIDYKDLVSFIPVLKQPTVSINFVKYTKDGMEYNLIINNLDSADGVILSYYDGNNMKELNKIAKREINNGKTTVTIPYGYDNNFKIKTYKEYDNETLYSEYSNGFNIDTRLEKTSISTHELRNGSETETGVEYFLNISGKQLDYVDGIELYYSTSETDEYTLLKRVTSNRIKDDNYKITVPAPHGYSNYYKVRMYKTYSDETVYSDYSQYNIDSTFGKPSISGCEWVDYVGNGVIEYSLDLDNFENNVGVYPTGVELYYATSLDGEYSLLTTTDTIVNKINFKLIGGKHYYLKARSYFDADTKIYSEFSNIYDRIEF